ncbi:MAG: hypothetical protein VSS75_018360 [Candidatus Parabeggiatoa sp.]|nr:hypothetical protein [Candidatus Parabeggiatoa sp.]
MQSGNAIALGCRDYSLYDFRVHSETGEPYLLEAGLFRILGCKSTVFVIISVRN